MCPSAWVATNNVSKTKHPPHHPLPHLRFSQLVLDEAPNTSGAPLSLASRAGFLTHASLLRLATLSPPSHDFQVAVSGALAGKKQGGSKAKSLTDGVSAYLAANMKGSLPAASRVTVQVDARDAFDTKALVARAQALVAACTEAGLKPQTDVLLRIHATYEGIAAAKTLEAQGIATLISGVYSLAQGIAAVDAGASVVLVGNRKLGAWYAAHPNVHAAPIGGTRGTRGDAGSLASSAAASAEAGRDLVAAVQAYAQQKGRRSTVMAVATSAEEVRELAGTPILLVPPKVVMDLAASNTLAGYNDGLSAVSGGAETAHAGDVAPLSARMKERLPSLAAALATAASGVAAATTAAAFAACVKDTCPAGMELTQRDVDRDASAASSVQAALMKLSHPTGGA